MSGENIKVCVVLEYFTAMKKIKALTLVQVVGPGAGERPRHKGHTVDSMSGVSRAGIHRQEVGSGRAGAGVA